MAMTFWGRYRGDDGKEAHGDDHAPGKHEHHPHVPHESPKSMWVPLVVLAILATVGGFVGISTAFTGGREVGGRLNIVHWLNPVIWNPTTKSFHIDEPLSPAQEAEIAETPHISELRALPSAPDRAGFNLAHAVEARLGSETATEWMFIVISLIVAGIGIGLGLLFYIKDTAYPTSGLRDWRPCIAPATTSTGLMNSTAGLSRGARWIWPAEFSILIRRSSMVG